jgi:hypothetical protein
MAAIMVAATAALPPLKIVVERVKGRPDQFFCP